MKKSEVSIQTAPTLLGTVTKKYWTETYEDPNGGPAVSFRRSEIVSVKEVPYIKRFHKP